MDGKEKTAFDIGFAIGLFAGLMAAIIVAAAVRIHTIRTVSEYTQNYTDEMPKIAEYTNETVVIDKCIDDGIDDETRTIIEKVVSAEARGEGYLGMVAVAQTIKDRGDIWGMDYIDVVLAEGQFAEPYDGNISDLVRTAVHEVFDLGYRATELPTTHFYDHEILSSPPYWAEGKTVIARIGCHTFMY